MERETLITLTADIVAAHVANNHVGVGDMSNLIQQVHGALSGLAKPAERAPESRQPAVSVRSSVKPDAITCLVCGARQRTLKRHLARAHDLTPTQYRAEFGLPESYPMTAPDYSAKRSEMAKSLGLGRKGKGAGSRRA